MNSSKLSITDDNLGMVWIWRFNCWFSKYFSFLCKPLCLINSYQVRSFDNAAIIFVVAFFPQNLMDQRKKKTIDGWILKRKEAWRFQEELLVSKWDIGKFLDSWNFKHTEHTDIYTSMTSLSLCCEKRVYGDSFKSAVQENNITNVHI